MRISIPLGINESPAPATALERQMRLLLPMADDPLDQAERDRTFWMCYILERTTNMSTVWATCMDNSDITVELPVLQTTYDRGYGELKGKQTLHSPDFFSNHPEEHADGLSLMIKSVKLITDVLAFLRRYARGPHSITKYVNEPQLRTLLSTINIFRQSFPAHLRRHRQLLSTDIDPDALTATMIAHAAAILLCEPLLTPSTWKSDLANVGLAAIRANLSILYDITSTSYDLTLLPSKCCFVWSLSTRGLGRLFEAAQSSNDTISASVFRSEMQVFKMAMDQYGERFACGKRHGDMVTRILQSAESVSTAFACNDDAVFDPAYTSAGYMDKDLRKRAVPSASSRAESIATPSSGAMLSTGLVAGEAAPGKVSELDGTIGGGFDIASWAFDTSLLDGMVSELSGVEGTFEGVGWAVA